MSRPTRSEPVWLSRLVIDVIHQDQIARHGGRPGVRDEGAVEASLPGPRHRWAHDQDADMADLAAGYAFAFVRNHGFVDGNKRVAFMATFTFLGMNGRDLNAPEREAVTAVVALSASDLSERRFASWLRRHMHPSAER